MIPFAARGFVAIACCVLLLWSGSATAQDSKPVGHIVVVTGDDAARRDPVQQQAAAALLAKARAEGHVRVIIGLRLSLRHEDELSAGARRRQVETLRAAQSAVVRRVLGRSHEAFQRNTPTRDSTVVLFDHIPYLSLIVDATQLARVLADPQVVNVQEDVPSRLQSVLQPDLDQIGVTDVHAKGITGKGQTVAILDNGIWGRHVVFDNKIVSEACYSTNTGTNSSLCRHGVTQSTDAGAGTHCPVTTVPDICQHGTHVASVAAGGADVTTGFNGVASGATIIAIQIFSRTPTGTSSYATDQVKALERVFALRDTFKIAAVNLSVGDGVNHPAACNNFVTAHAAIIGKLKKAAIATIIAAGNDGFRDGVNWPACETSAIAVGSVGDTDTLSSFSNYSPLVRLFAPGEGIEGANLSYHGLVPMSGTSMAAPHVTGAFALHREKTPKATVDRIAQNLECTGLSVEPPSFVARPRIDVFAALGYVLPYPSSTTRWDFSTKKEADAWKQLLGTWAWDQPTGTYLAVSADATKSWALAGLLNCNESFNFTTQVTLYKDPMAFGNAGTVTLGLKSQLDTDNNFAGFLFFIKEHPSNANKVAWDVEYRRDNGQVSLPCTDYYFKTPPNGTVLSGVTARIEVRGSKVAYILNGKTVCRFNIARTAGAAMIGAQSLGTDGKRKLLVDYVEIEPVTSADTPVNLARRAAGR